MIFHPPRSRRLHHRADDLDADASGEKYWLSYSDLMAAMLLVFTLLLLSALQYFQSSLGSVRKLAEIRRDLARELALGLAVAGGGAGEVSVDRLTGAVRMPDHVLFGENEEALSDAGRNVLQRFAAVYLPFLLDSPRYRAQLRFIVIEGHTNDNGTYLYNLDLSQRRALSVMSYLLQTGVGQRYGGDLQRYLTARGRSFSDLLCHGERPDTVVPCAGASGAPRVAKEESRRIEIDLELKDRELLEELMGRLYGGKAGG